MLNLIVFLEAELLHGFSKGRKIGLVGDVELTNHSNVLLLLSVVDVLLLVKISQEAGLVSFVSLSEQSNMSSEVVLLIIECSGVSLLLVSQSSLVQVLLLLEGS